MTAPNDPNNPNDPNVKSPIQPGQFVTSGEEESGVFKQPPTPEPQQASLEPPSVNLDTLQPNPEPPTQPVTEPRQFANQPSPTPYVPPATSGQTPPSQPSTITKLRIVLVILGFLLIALVLAAGAWFFMFRSTGEIENTAVESENSQVEIPTPRPARSSGGFSELPQATEESQEATSEAQ